MESGFLIHTDDVFRRLSFGFNGQSNKNSCTAVAFGIALNYLNRTRIENYVSADIQAENLQKRNIGAWDEQHYPNASALHHYLLGECKLKSGPFGRWGRGVTRRLQRHYQVEGYGQLPVSSSCRYTVLNPKGAWQLIKEQIDLDIPVVVTTNLRLLSSNEFGQHSMAVCGYQESEQSGRTLFAHSGWYEGYVHDGLAKLVSIPFEWVLCFYSFELDLKRPAQSATP